MCIRDRSNPTIQQVQEININIDPSNIISGNSNLKPSFSNNYSLLYVGNKPSRERSLIARLKFSHTNNAISYQTFVDSFGRKAYVYVNLNGIRYFNQNIDYSYRISKLDMFINITASHTRNRFINIINSKTIATYIYNSDLAFSISKEKENIFDASLELAVFHKSGRYRIQTDEHVAFLNYRVSPAFDLYLPLKLTLHTNCTYTVYTLSLIHI